MKWKAVSILGLAIIAAGCAPDQELPTGPTEPTMAGPAYAYVGNTTAFGSTWFQGFEVDAIDWTNTSRVPSNSNGVTSAAGDFHGEATSGAFTRFNAYSAAWPGDYKTEIDAYLDPAWEVGQGFDYSVASSNSAGALRRDFIFHVGVHADGRLLVNGSNNTDFVVNDFKLLNDGDGTPYHVTTAGWYKFRHVFYDDAGVLAVDLQLVNSGGTVLFTTTRKNVTDLIGTNIGGNRYGWFTFSTRTLAIDNQSRAAAALQSPSTLALIITPSSPVFDANNVVGVSGDAASGFSSGSFASDGTGKTDIYFTPEVLFAGREISVEQVARMSYWTKKGTTHVVDPADWYVAIYTKPFAGDVSTPGWYGSRFGSEPYFSADLAAPTDTWNQWSTNLTTNTLRFFESTQGAPGASFGSYTDSAWANFIGANALGTSVRRASQQILFFSIQTGSAWADGFTGQLDGLRIELTDGSVATINFEPDTPVDDESPVVSNVAVTPNPAPYTTASYALTASATDNVAVTSASYTINGGTPVDFAFAPGSPVSLGASIGPLAVGVYDICVTAADDATNTSNTECTMLAVYDPSAGFVTGGGWFMSPEGAYLADAGLTGKATFGFVSKYVKGKTLPTGNTQFQFQAGGLTFSSSEYEWLVVNQGGMNAQFKGVGILNGVPGYKFMVWAKDGTPDTFRIQITDGSGAVAYDNHQSGSFGTPLGGGSIMIHVPKK